jgi:hypothetical protein
MKPWTQMTYEERAAVYYEYSLKVNDIEWYRFHGMDPRRPAHN